ncbi:hypothetical protein [Piscinibacter sp.]|uniref:hypothetical protein n=1 Tax=Piscinibacter sp. TaxID=1903157 RepID=UPI0035AFE102
MSLHLGASSASMPLVLQDPASLSPEARALRRAELIRAHRAVGVDPQYLSLPDGQQLWFVHVVLDLEVHAGCLGFTRHLFEYAAGATPDEADQAVRSYFVAVAPDVHVIQAHAKPSSAEHPEELTFPEQVRRLDMPPRPLTRTLLS